MTNENEDQEQIEETTDEGSPVDPLGPVAQLAEYAAFMDVCFDAAESVMRRRNFVSESANLREIALALFNRCTREVPGQAKIVTLALEYMTMLTKEQEAQKELNSRPIAPFVSSMPPCKHPQLAALREVLLDHNDSFSLIGKGVIEALSVEIFGIEDPMLCCPACREVVSVEKFKDGSLFSESEARHKDASESPCDTKMFSGREGDEANQ